MTKLSTNCSLKIIFVWHTSICCFYSQNVNLTTPMFIPEILFIYHFQVLPLWLAMSDYVHLIYMYETILIFELVLKDKTFKNPAKSTYWAIWQGYRFCKTWSVNVKSRITWISFQTIFKKIKWQKFWKNKKYPVFRLLC